VTPEWYQTADTRETKDTACIRGYRKELLDKIPAYDEASEDYIKFREFITKVRADLDEAYQWRRTPASKRALEDGNSSETHVVDDSPSGLRSTSSLILHPSYMLVPSDFSAPYSSTVTTPGVAVCPCVSIHSSST
jgi:hypothetical protein